jgi:hypothetical protein
MSSAPGAVVAARVLERAGALERPEEQAKEQPAEVGGWVVSLRAMIALAVRTDQERILFGFELTEEQRAAVLEDEGDPRAADHRSPGASTGDESWSRSR